MLRVSQMLSCVNCHYYWKGLVLDGDTEAQGGDIPAQSHSAGYCK